MSARMWLRTGAMMALVAMVGAACDDGAAPDVDFDPQAAADAMESMVVATEGLEDALGSMAAASTLFEGSGAASVLPDGPRIAPEAEALRQLAAAGAMGFFPANYLGVTFVWSEIERHYVPSELDGAPLDGIRIIYYAVDPVTEEPASPLNALGHVDLRDLSSPASDRLGVTIRRDGQAGPLADYFIDVSHEVTETLISVDVLADGYLSNGTDQLNFALGQGLELSESLMVLSQDFAMDLEGTDIGVSYHATFTGDAETETGSLSAAATITNGPEVVTLELSAEDQALDGVVRYQGVAVAFIGGTFDQPTFTDRNGEPLSQEDLQALADLWEAVGSLFELAEGIFGVAE